MVTRIRPSRSHSRIRMRARRLGGDSQPEDGHAEGSFRLLWLCIGSAVALAIACYWLFFPYGMQPIDGGIVTVNWAFTKLDREATRIDDRLTIVPVEDAYVGQPFVVVPDKNISLAYESVECFAPDAPEEYQERWRIWLHPQSGCADAPLVLRMPQAHTIGRHFRNWVQFAWYGVEQRAGSIDDRPATVNATFTAPFATSQLTRELSNLVYSAYSSRASSSDYQCETLDAAADVTASVKCSARIDHLPHELFTAYVPGWSYRFETPSYPALSIAVPSFLSAVFGATISGLPPFVPWRSRRKVG